MHHITKRLTAVALTLAIVLSCGNTMAFALEADLPAGQEMPAAQPEATPTATEEPTPTPSENAGSIADSTAEPTVEPSATATATDEPSAAPCAIPAGEEDTTFSGMPENFTLSEQQCADKQALADAQTGALTQLQNAEEGKDYISQQVIFSAEDDAFAQEVAQAYDGELLTCASGVAVVELPEDVTVSDAVAAAADMKSNLPAVEPNYIVTLWPEEAPIQETQEVSYAQGLVTTVPYSLLWEDWTAKDPCLREYKASTYQWMHEAVDTYSAWGTTQGNPGVSVAVLDSGIFSTQEDLSGRVAYRHADYKGSDGTVYSGAGDHGSNVAGIIGATYGNGKGGSGIAPHVTLKDYQVLSTAGSGSTAAIAQGVYDAATEGADIINMSLGGCFYSQTFQNNINYATSKGTVVVVAAGNDGGNVKCYPAGYKNVICVGAANKDGSRAAFSNFGSWVTVSAPGVDMYSSSNGTTSYVNMNGTSQATPVVSGVIALYMSAVGDYQGDVNADGCRDAKDVAQVTRMLRSTVTPALSSGMGAGIVNAGKLLGKVIAAPEFALTVNGNAVTSGTGGIVVPSGSTNSKLTISADMTSYYIAYTTDKTTPKVVNGELINGMTYTGPMNLETLGEGTHTIKAIAVNGSGLCSAVKTITFTVSISKSSVSGSAYLSLSAPKYVGQGKTVKITPTVTGIKGKVTWKVVSGNATVNSSGYVKANTAAEIGSTIVIQATVKSGLIVGDKTISVIVAAPVTAIQLAATQNQTQVLYNGKVSNTTNVVLTPTIMAGTMNYSSRKADLLTWKTNNAKIATVSSSGVVTPTGKGVAIITAVANDGSGRSATFRMNVQLSVTGLTLTPATAKVARGKSVRFTVGYAPTGAANKSVTWTIDTAAAVAGGAKISTSGVLSIPTAFPLNITSVTVRATSKDTGVYQNYTVGILSEQAYKVTISLNGSNKYFGVYNTSDGLYADNAVLRSVQLFTSPMDSGVSSWYDTKAGTALDETTATLSAGAFTRADVSTGAPLIWKSSDASIIAVNAATGVVTAKKAGSARITATAQDGTGRAATLTVTAIVPTSGLTITSKNAISENSGSSVTGIYGMTYVSAGTNTTFRATQQKMYGTPTNKAVKWSLQAYGSYKNPADLGISVTSGGVLRVPNNSAITAYLSSNPGYRVYLTAACADRSNVTQKISVPITLRTTAVGMPKAGNYFNVYTYSSSGYQYAGRLYQGNLFPADGDSYKSYFYSDCPSDMFTLSSSTGNLQALGYTLQKSSTGAQYYVCVNKKYYKLYYMGLVSCKYSTSQYWKYGSASVRVTAADGTNRSAAITLRTKY